MAYNPLRNLPSVSELIESPVLKSLMDRINRNVVVSTVRTVLDEVGQEVRNAASDRTLPSAADLAERIARRIVEGQPLPLQPVINATGNLLDSGLSGVPLAEEAVVEMAAVARDYASLDRDPANGQSGRPDGAVESLLQELTGAEAALAVNSNAGAALLSLAALAAGREVIVSRGQLIEIDDAFRLPEVIATSGAVLREVGTANKTRPDDYVEAIGPSTAALLLVHPNNVAPVGCESVTLEELVGVGRRGQLPVIHDIDSAAMIDLRPHGLPGPPIVGDSIKGGADIVLLSGDKLVGGPPCGLILGRKRLIAEIQRHPMARVLRIDRLTLTALAATLRLYRDPEKARLGIPLLRLLTTSAENLRNRAERLAPQAAAVPAIAEATAMADATRCGWGPSPAQELPTWCVALRPATMTVDRLATALRTGAPAVVGRQQDGRLLLDLRTVLPRQDTQILAALESLDKQESATGPSNRL